MKHIISLHAFFAGWQLAFTILNTISGHSLFSILWAASFFLFSASCYTYYTYKFSQH